MANIRVSLNISSSNVLSSSLNLEPELENYVYLHNDTDTGLVAKLGGGEFAFIPINPDKKHEVYATKVDTMIEYGVFGNDDSANQYGGT